jgi:hypothetical protein
MSKIGNRLVVTISGDSNVADGVAHPWDTAEHVHVRTDSRTTYPGEEYRIEIVEEGRGYWIAEVRENIDVRTVNEEISTDGRNSEKVYWVRTGKSYCYHTNPNCKRLNKHQGDRASAQINRTKGEIPDPVKERRPCPDC